MDDNLPDLYSDHTDTTQKGGGWFNGYMSPSMQLLAEVLPIHEFHMSRKGFSYEPKADNGESMYTAKAGTRKVRFDAGFKDGSSLDAEVDYEGNAKTSYRRPMFGGNVRMQAERSNGSNRAYLEYTTKW